MAGIYIHIPFCKKKCHYCDFYKSTNLGLKVQLLNALMQELEQRKIELSGDTIETIYLGGGTPSVLSSSEIDRLLQHIFGLYNVADDAEITQECNPDDLNLNYLTEIRQKGVNRLSIGIQSFRTSDLQLMNRRHSPEQAISAVEMARKAGFENISIDLIYGLPNQGLTDWESNIQQAISLKVEHISAYHLTYHEGTIFNEKRNAGSLHELPDEESLQQFIVLKKNLEKAGFEQYEISNFARNGYYSRHNKSYWFQEKYLGIGPSAHSFDGSGRRWNISSLNAYLDGIEKGAMYFDSEQLNRFDQYNDYIITRLRTIWGVSENDIEPEFISHFKNTLARYEHTGHVHFLKNKWILTDEGLFISDKIMEDLIVTSP